MTARDDTPSELDPLLRQALAWVIRLHSGAATSDDAAALTLWRQRSPEHELAFRDAVRLWRRLGEAARELADESGRPQLRQVEPPRAAPSLSRRALLGGTIAACVAGGYLIVRPPFGLWPSFEEISADYHTGKGQRRKVALADNVSLILNTQTSVAVLSRPGAPSIRLISGEAAVQTTDDGAAPFVLDAAGGEITAREASYNVKCLDGTVSVSCITGRVDIVWKGQQARLAGDQQLSYSVDAGLTPTSRADIEQASAWPKGLLIVRDWPVTRLVDEINRYRPGRIVVTDAELGRRMISGTFYIDHLDDFVAQAQSLFGANARTLPGGIVFLN